MVIPSDLLLKYQNFLFLLDNCRFFFPSQEFLHEIRLRLFYLTLDVAILLDGQQLFVQILALLDQRFEQFETAEVAETVATQIK